MGLHLGGTLTLGLVLGHNLGPEHTGGTEFCKFHEEVARYAHIELDAAGHFRCVASGLGEQAHPVGSASQSISEFLIYVCTGVAEHVAVNCKHAQAAHVLDGVEQFAGHLHEFVGCKSRALALRFLEGVEVDGAFEGLVGAVLLHISHEGFGQRQSFFQAATEVDFDLGGVNAVEQCGHCLGCGFLHLESERSNTLGEHVECYAVGFCGCLGDNFLAHEPVIIGAGAAEIWILSRQ